MNRAPTMRSLLDGGTDGSPAILAPGRLPLSFAALRRLVDHTGGALPKLGIGCGERVAMVLPNGAEMAAAFIAVGCHTTVAPLNPSYGRREFEFYLSDLNAAALLLEKDATSPAADAANQLGIRIIELVADNAWPAGTFALEAKNGKHGQFDAAPSVHAGKRADQENNVPGAAANRRTTPDDIALVLHTSGTTSRPKIVPLTHRNIYASARNITQTLHLGPDDRCLNVMPLFHIHGLMAGLLAPLSAGGSVFAAPAFDALRFFTWLKEAHPTWYTAVPSMHQAILRRASRRRGALNDARLRFLRSASAPLPAKILAELETVFGVPVVEAYAMTEGTHQVTSNPLPPGERRPGSVGLAAGPEIAIMDAHSGELLSPGETGEVVIRGDSVMNGYEANAEANASAFVGDWLRTGDQAVMDDGGYLTITGRLKEIINRGGEKISPREVDEVLLDHPAIAQAVTFAVPHALLGEEVAAAVVLRDGTEAEREEIRQFLAKRLAAFKVPRQIVTVTDLPKGATGKLQRIGLAQKLGLI